MLRAALGGSSTCYGLVAGFPVATWVCLPMAAGQAGGLLESHSALAHPGHSCYDGFADGLVYQCVCL